MEREQHGTGIDRRAAVLGGLGLLAGAPLLGACAAAAPSGTSAAGRPARPTWPGWRGTPRPLVLLQLSGGNDGLSTVVPFGDDAYHAARPTLALGPAEVLRLDGHRGLHPALSGLRRHFDAGRLAIVEGVGYPEPNRSHFRSLDVWHAADPRGRDVPEGWIGRVVRAARGEASDPNRVIHVGGRVPYALHSAVHAPASFSVPQAYRWTSNREQLESFERSMGERPPGNDSVELLRAVMRDARESSLAVRQAVERHRSAIAWPSSAFAGDLQIVSALLHGELGCWVLSLELAGFDTHVDQRRRHDQLLQTLDGGLSAFLDELGTSEVGRATVVLVFSEFGRRVAENGSRGTDHGTAAPLLVAGHDVRGGLHGAPPSLTELDAGDLVHTTDFRRAYAAVAAGCFGVDPGPVLGPFEPLEVL